MIRSLSFCATILMLSAGFASADGYRDFNAGAFAASRGDHDAAIKSFSLAISEPDIPAHLLPTAHMARGYEYVKANQFDLAIADFSAAIALKPDWIDAYEGRCAGYSAKALFAQAVADCSKAVQLQPQNWLLHNNRIAVYLQMKDFGDVVEDYSTFMSSRPNDGDLLIGRTLAYWKMGEIDKALSDTETLSGIVSEQAVASKLRGLIYFSEGNYSKAKENLDSAVDYAPLAAIGYVSKGMVSWAVGDFEGASDEFRRSFVSDPLQPYAFLWLSISQSRLAAKVPQDVTDRIAATSLSGWPGPLESLYLDRSTPDSLLALKGRDPDLDEDVQCTVSFFVGEWYEIHGNLTQAERLLQAATNSCETHGVQRKLAAIELSRLH